MSSSNLPGVKIQIQFFSIFKDLTGKSKMGMQLEDGATITRLLEILYREFQSLQKWDSHLLVAVGFEYVERSYMLKQNDLVSIMPPVQGG